MITDFNAMTQNVMDADVCIVGSGAAGMTCAMEFLNTGLRVIMLEGGNRFHHNAAADLHRGEVIGLHHNGIHSARERVLGGTTTTWGGQALPFLDEDFQHRPWVRNSGWPIGAAELEDYYLRASVTLGLDTRVPFSMRPWSRFQLAEPNFNRDTLQLFVTRWSPQPNFARRFGPAITASQSLHLIYNANAVALCPKPAPNHIHKVSIKSLIGREGSVRARNVILAGGAIETARLLLVSRDAVHPGVGNTYDMVGRYFQDHSACIIGLLSPANRKAFHEIFEPFYIRGYKYFPRLRLSPNCARQRKTLHASVQVVILPHPSEAIEASKTIVKAIRAKRFSTGLMSSALNVSRRPFDLVQAAWWRGVKKRGIFSRRSAVWLECQSEQEPDPESRVKLSNITRDALGMPRVCLDWRVSESTYNTIRETARITLDQFKQTGVGNAILDDWVVNRVGEWKMQIGDVFHQCGTTRMGASETSGVVNPNCEVYGMPNVYVAGAGVFPTSSFSNPTMTAIALSIRVCDHLKKRING